MYDAAVTSSPTGFFRNARSIGVLAVLLVVATAIGVAAVVHWLGQLSWPMSFVLGTAVGPTDAAAATSVARRLGLPRRLVTILEGEALFNDATALVLYAAAVAAATTGHFSALDYLGAACDAGTLPPELTDGLRAQYLARLRRLETMTDDEGPPADAAVTAEADLVLRRDLIAFQRRTLGGLRRQGRVGVTTLRAIERDLDLEEARLPPA